MPARLYNLFRVWQSLVLWVHTESWERESWERQEQVGAARLRVAQRHACLYTRQLFSYWQSKMPHAHTDLHLWHNQVRAGRERGVQRVARLPTDNVCLAAVRSAALCTLP